MADPLTVPVGTGPDELFERFSAWTADRGLALYPHQEEALLALLGDDHVVLATGDEHEFYAGAISPSGRVDEPAVATEVVGEDGETVKVVVGQAPPGQAPRGPFEPAPDRLR